MTKIRNKTLTNDNRETMIAFAQNNIKCEAEEQALATCYKLAKPIVLKVVHEKYPPKDMKVLKKYNQARTDYCIQFGAYFSRETVFKFNRDDKDAPLVSGVGSGCNEHLYTWTSEQKQHLIAYQLAREALEKAQRTKLDHYRRLIIGSRTFNDVAAIWPAIEALRERIIPITSEQRALATLSQDTIALIRNDNAGAQKAAA